MSLSKEEQDVMDSLVKAWNDFLELPVYHQWDQQEFMHGIHQCQKIIMARPSQREMLENKNCEYCGHPLKDEEDVMFGYHKGCIPF